MLKLRGVSFRGGFHDFMIRRGGLDVFPRRQPEPRIASSRRWRYDPNGNVVASVVENYAADTETPQDGAGPQSAPVMSYTYDRAGDVLSQTDPNLDVTSTVYDRHGRKTQVIQPAVSDDVTTATPITTYAYDPSGNVVSVTDPLNHATTTVFDALNRKMEVLQPDPDGAGPLTSPTSFYAYDANGNLTQVTDARSNVTTTGYDRANRKTVVTQADPDGAGPVAHPSYASLLLPSSRTKMLPAALSGLQLGH